MNKLMLGGNIFGHFTNLEETARILSLAHDLGIRAIDTADVYSEGESERQIGQLIGSSREDWFLASKVGQRSHESPNGLGRRANIFGKVENSLRRLKTDYLDLYQLHNFDPITPIEETLRAFEDLQSQGKIRHGGISNFGVQELLDVAAPIAYHQIPLNLSLFPQMFGVCEKSTAKNLKLIAYSVLGRGLFSERYLTGQIPKGSRAECSERVRNDLTTEFSERLEQMHSLCVESDHTLISAALQWALSLDAIEYAIIGVRTVDQLKQLYVGVEKSIDAILLQKLSELWDHPSYIKQN